MGWILNLFYGLLLVAISPLLLWKAWRHGKYREGWRAKLTGAVPVRGGLSEQRDTDDSRPPCIWLHAVSLGEVNLLATLLAELKRRRPDVACYITTTTRTGYEAACRLYGDEHDVSYCPLDFTWAVRRAVRRIQPDLLVLAELELWPNLIREVDRTGAKVAVVNARLSAKSFAGYRKLSFLVAAVLRRVDLIAAQDSTYADRFRALGALEANVHVSGSLKFDGAKTDRTHARIERFRALANVQPDELVWLAGSTFPPEESLVISVFEELAEVLPALRLVLVPRHPERFDDVAMLLDESSLSWTRRSKLSPGNSLGAERVVLVDTTGELGDWWGLSQIAFVGGSFGPRGGQNMIEPAAYGAAVSFGPKTGNFRDVVQLLLGDDAAVVVEDREQLLQFVRQCASDSAFREDLGARAKTLVMRNLGATSATLDLLEPLLPARNALRRSA